MAKQNGEIARTATRSMETPCLPPWPLKTLLAISVIISGWLLEVSVFAKLSQVLVGSREIDPVSRSPCIQEAALSQKGLKPAGRASFCKLDPIGP